MKISSDTFATYNRGPWLKEQTLKYRIFLEFHQSSFQLTPERKTQRLFYEMSVYLKTRLSKQCRSHHQKMEKRHGTIKKIIDYLQRKEEQAKPDSEQWHCDFEFDLQKPFMCDFDIHTVDQII